MSGIYAIHTVMSTDSTVFFCSQTRQKNQCNEASRPYKRAQRYLDIKHGEVSLQIESAALPPKTTTSLWNENEKMTG
jgi:hypothetical protein